MNNSPNNTGLTDLPPAIPAMVYYHYSADPAFDWSVLGLEVGAPANLAARITALLMAQKDALARSFGHALSSCEPPQFLRYLRGDFFVAHQDGNTPLIHDHSRFRKVSAVLFLSARPGFACFEQR